MIQILSRTRNDIPHMEVNLATVFPDKIYCKTLLQRLKNKYLDKTLGHDRVDLPGLSKLAAKTIREGGTFEIVPDDESMCIAFLHVQKATWREYAIQYGTDGPKMVDGTHGTNQHGWLGIPWTLIDGLLHSQLAGVTYHLTENRKGISEGAKLFYAPIDEEILLTNPNATLICPSSAMITDEGKAFPSVAKGIGCGHLLDRPHFTQGILPSSAHMSPAERNAYSDLIYDILDATNVEQLNAHLQQAKATYGSHPNTSKFLDKIDKLRDKVCWSLTNQYMTCGHVSDQRTVEG